LFFKVGMSASTDSTRLFASTGRSIQTSRWHGRFGVRRIRSLQDRRTAHGRHHSQAIRQHDPHLRIGVLSPSRTCPPVSWKRIA
jgi:hypothetical protein